MEKQSLKYSPATTGKARAFVIPGGARQDREIHYASYMRVDSGSQSLGDVTPIRMNDPNAFDRFIDVGFIRGSKSNPTTSLVEKLPLEIRSTIDRLARSGVPFDVHIQFGECFNPSDIRQFASGIVYEYANATSHDNDALIALDDGENSEIRETLAVSAQDRYRYVPLGYSNRAAEDVINEIVDVFIKRTRDCADDPAKPMLQMAVTKAEGGSPGTGPYFFWSLDGGATWHSHDVDSLSASDDASGVAVIGDYIVVTSAGAKKLAYTEVAPFYHPDVPGFDPLFSSVATGLKDNPMAIDSIGIMGFVVGDSGYVYKVDEVALGAQVVDDGNASGGNRLNAVYAFDESSVIAVGNAGTVVYSHDGKTFSAAPKAPVGVGVNLISCAMRYADEWWVGANDGTLYVTFDSGVHWTKVTLPGTTPSSITGITWASHSVGYVAATVSGAGRIYRTICGGIVWGVEPQLSTYAMPKSTKLNKIAADPEDVNRILVGGANSTDGVLILGTDAKV